MTSKIWLGLALLASCGASAHAIELNTFSSNESGRYASNGRTKCWPNQKIETQAKLERVVDGDTVYVRTTSGTYSVRMMGIDTPETHYLGKSQGKWGDAAAARMNELVRNGDDVTLDLGDETCDKYGRVLAWVHKGNMNLNGQMVREGLAVNYCIGPGIQHCEEFGALVANAMEKKLGMWSEEAVELPYDYRRRVGNRPFAKFVGNMKTKKVYMPGQDFRVPVADRVYFMREEDIRAPFARVR